MSDSEAIHIKHLSSVSRSLAVTYVMLPVETVVGPFTQKSHHRAGYSLTLAAMRLYTLLPSTSLSLFLTLLVLLLLQVL